MDVDLISTIMGLLRAGLNPITLFEKGKNPTHIAKVKEKYDLVSSGKEFLISSINDPTTRTEATILTHKLLLVSRLKQCTTGIVMLVAL